MTCTSTSKPMGPRSCGVLLLLALLALCWVPAAVLCQSSLPGAPPKCSLAVRRSIAWGTGTAAQVHEGAAHVGGRTDSVWDVFARKPGTIRDGSKPEVAADFYHRYKQDITLLKGLGLKHFRFSISWPRLIPKGVAGSPVNQAALRFYNALLNEVKAAGMQPLVVLFEWDVPQALQAAYGGFVSPRIVDDFAYFADVAFGAFGDQVARWITFNEPFVTCNQQYGNGQFAPGNNLGDAGRYKCGHNLLIAHANATALYRRKYKPRQRGQLSMSMVVTWGEPLNPGSVADARAVQNKFDFEVGWFLDPVYRGDYPASLRASKGSVLPRFSAAQQAALKGSLDFAAINCFTAKYVSAVPHNPNGWSETKVRNGQLIGAATGIPWMNVVPSSYAKALVYVSKRYGKPDIMTASSGTMVPGEAALRPPAVQRDAFRIQYYSAYLDEVCAAVARGDVKLKLWMALFALDSWEHTDGFTTKWGVVHVDFASGSLKRTPKDSALWLSRHFWSQSA